MRPYLRYEPEQPPSDAAEARRLSRLAAVTPLLFVVLGSRPSLSRPGRVDAGPIIAGDASRQLPFLSGPLQVPQPLVSDSPPLPQGLSLRLCHAYLASGVGVRRTRLRASSLTWGPLTRATGRLRYDALAFPPSPWPVSRGKRSDAYRDDALPAASLPLRMTLAFRNSARRRDSQCFS